MDRQLTRNLYFTNYDISQLALLPVNDSQSFTHPKPDVSLEAMGNRQLLAVVVCLSAISSAQVSGKFYLEKQNYALGEPIFVKFEVRNDGTEATRLYSADPNGDCTAFSVKVSSDKPPSTFSCGRGISCMSSDGQTHARREAYRTNIVELPTRNHRQFLLGDGVTSSPNAWSLAPCEGHARGVSYALFSCGREFNSVESRFPAMG